MESGKFNLAITEFDINQVISLCILNLEHKIKEKGLNVKATFHDKRAYVLGDRDRIIQVVTNIIENAIKYSNDDGEINHNELLKKLSVNYDDLKFEVSFDININLDSKKSYKANMKLELPIGNVVDDGIQSKENTDLENIIFKRI